MHFQHYIVVFQDVLFGRGGLTNHHIGNLRYRDIIEIHRQDYVHAPKTEKPNVARRIVKAIRTGVNPGRFLKKDGDGKWREVSDREAAWKASQALREKSRWTSMKMDKEGSDNSNTMLAVSEAMDSSTVQKVVESASSNTVKKVKKHNPHPTDKEAEEELMGGRDAESNHPNKKSKSENSTAETVPMEASHIAVPPVEPPAGKKAGTVFLRPQNSDSDHCIIPKDEDVLFGRGGRTNHHPGNLRLRQIVETYRHIYYRKYPPLIPLKRKDTLHVIFFKSSSSLIHLFLEAKKIDKPNVSKLIVGALRSANPPSRFLRLNEETSRWEDVGDKRAAEKVSQTLREKDRVSKTDDVVIAPTVIPEETHGKTLEAANANGAELPAREKDPEIAPCVEDVNAEAFAVTSPEPSTTAEI